MIVGKTRVPERAWRCDGAAFAPVQLDHVKSTNHSARFVAAPYVCRGGRGVLRRDLS
jgi:hypothetical protein